MKLIEQKKDYCPSLVIDEIQIISAAENKQNRIKNVNKKDLLLRLNEIISKAYIQAGVKSKSDASFDRNHVELVKDFAKELQDYFSSLTLDEVELAIFKGLRGEYGQYYGINQVELSKFAKAYKKGFERAVALEKQRKYKEKMSQPQELPEEEKQKIFYASALRKFSDYKKTKTFFDAGSVTYDYLARLKIIDYSEEERSAFKIQAKKNLEEDVKQKVSQNTLSSIQVMDYLKNITNKSVLVVSEAKRIALAQYFEKLISSNTQLHQKIDLALQNKQ